MTNSTYSITYPGPQGGVRYRVTHSDSSVSSPKVNGKLKLRANPHSKTHRIELNFEYDPRFEFRSAPASALTPIVGTAGALPSNAVFVKLRNEALARFTGKVRKHNASLGVTIGSIGQTMRMITDRTQKIGSILDKATKDARKLSPAQKRRAVAKDRAGDVLEWEFGWMPLVSDIQAGFDTLARTTPPGYVSASARGMERWWVDETGSAYSFDRRRGYQAFCSVNIGAIVDVTNPNLWLANRLGLLNLPGVAWDLIPWSFVVNMFTNVGSMVNSLTDFYGLSMRDASTTYTSLATGTDYCFAGYAPRQFKTVGYASSTCQESLKLRVVGSIPTPSFQWRVPNMNLELAVIASSLMLQKLSALNRVFGFTVR